MLVGHDLRYYASGVAPALAPRAGWSKIWRFPARHGGTPKIDGLEGNSPIKMDDDWGYPYDYGDQH